MFRWLPYSFVRIVVFFIAGILLGIYIPDIIPAYYAYILFLLFAISYWVIAIKFRRQLSSYEDQPIKTITGFVGLSGILLAGHIILLTHTDVRSADHVMHAKPPVKFYEAVLTGYDKVNDRGWRVEANVLKVSNGKQWEQSSGKILLYFSKKDITVPYRYGDVLLIKGSPQLINPPTNPDEFDYRRYLSFKNIHHQHFVKRQDVIFIDNDPPNMFMTQAIACRKWAEEKLNQHINGEREQAIAAALVLGVTDGLDNDLLNAYSATGAMHVLAVSGLHVGIIYWMLLLILKPFNKTKSGRWTLAVVSIVVLWLYAFVTGLSPSVLRAVTMFSFVVLSRPLGNNTNIYNTLALSAFVLLLYDPYLIMSVGFQLSYLAVLGIVYFHPGLHRLWEPEGKVISFIWKTTSISIAAQVATFPLGLLYFHQFPNYFVISNLFVIPISSIILIIGLVMLMVSFASALAAFMGYLLVMLIKLMNFIVFAVASFPLSIIDDVYINATQCWLLIVIIISIILLAVNRKFKYVIVTTCLVIVFSTIQWLNYNSNDNHGKIAIYNVKGHKAIDLIERGSAFFIADSSLLDDAYKIKFHIKPNRLHNGINQITVGNDTNIMRSFTGCNVVCWKGLQLLNIDNHKFESPLTKVDYLIVSNNAVRDIKAIDHLTFKALIIDSSNEWRIADNLVKQTTKQSISTHSVLHEGAYVINL